MMNLGQKIQKYRKYNKLSQEQLGELVGVTRQTISNWELNESAPDISQAKELSRIFDISLDDLTDNNIEDVLLKNISKSKTISKVTLGITIIHFLLFLTVVIFTIIIIINTFQTKLAGEAVEINCKLANDNYYYQLDLDTNSKEIISFTSNDENIQTSFKYNDNERYEDVLDRIRVLVEQKGGICE